MAVLRMQYIALGNAGILGGIECKILVPLIICK